jgi:hypothetical protein
MRTVRSIIGLLAFAAALATAPAGASAAPCGDQFTGPSGGSWADAANWSAGVPGASTVACWGAGKTVVVGEGAQQAAAIAGGGGLLVSGQASLALGGAGEASALAGEVQTTEAGALDVAGTLACQSMLVGGGWVRDDGQIGCAVTVQGGRLTGTGAIAGSLNDDEGTVEAGDPLAFGGLHVAGAYVQQAGGTLVVGAGGLGAGEPGAIDVDGPVQLAGTVALAMRFLGAPGQSFAAIESPAAPAGGFTHVTGYTGGEPWTVEYGSQGVRAFYATLPLLHVSVSGSATPGSTVTCSPGEWAPGYPISYRWTLTDIVAVDRDTGLEPGGAQAMLAKTFEEDLTGELVLPGAAFEREIGCSASTEVQIAGSSAVSSHKEEASSSLVTVAGPYAAVEPAAIHGTPADGHLLTCTPGRREGNPTDYTYAWTDGHESLSLSSTYRIEYQEGEQLKCTVTAHYGGIAIPAVAYVEVRSKPLPVYCARQQVVLVSQRTVGSDLLLYGAAEPNYFGSPIHALLGTTDRRARRVASGTVGGEGYFLLKVPLAHGARSRGRYLVAVQGQRSNSLEAPGVLQIASDTSKPGHSQVTLRLARGVRSHANVTVSRVSECKPGPVFTAARLAPGATFSVSLTAGGYEPVEYVAVAHIRTRTYSVGLLVPHAPIELP